MEQVTDITISKGLNNSQFVKPFRVHYTQNGVEKSWDLVDSHDSVAILVHNITRDVFILVKQFRPAVYVCMAREKLGVDLTRIDPSDVNPADGCTLELCAGIVDKDKSLDQIACDEILEECGYQVQTNDLELITACRSGVGLSGSRLTLYYAKVTDDMKVSAGGGNPAEGELIEVVEQPVGLSLELIKNPPSPIPTTMFCALLWYELHKKAASDKN